MIERSEWSRSIPIMVVDKKDGGNRFCVKVRRVISKPLAAHRPLIDDILALLRKAKYFSTINVRSGY